MDVYVIPNMVFLLALTRQLNMIHYCLVVLTILKNISQWEGLSHILWKIKAMFETTNQISNLSEVQKEN